MKANKNSMFIYVLLLLVIMSIYNKVIYAETVEYPTTDKMREYIGNLLQTYNSYVRFYDYKKSYFSNYKNTFTLYLDEGRSFKIICVNSSKEVSNLISLIFIPIYDNEIQIIIDYDSYLKDYISGIEVQGSHIIFDNTMFSDENLTIQFDFFTFVTVNEVMVDTYKNSNNWAYDLYKTHKNFIRRDRIDQLWEPYQEENINIIYSKNLWNRTDTLNYNINWNESYLYEEFLDDFNNIVIIVNHYKDLQEMVNNYNEYINSDIVNIEYIKNDENIINLLNDIRYNVENNEYYCLNDYKDDMENVKYQVNSKITIVERENTRIARRDTNIYRLISLCFGGGYIILIIRERKSIKHYLKKIMN